MHTRAAQDGCHLSCSPTCHPLVACQLNLIPVLTFRLTSRFIHLKKFQSRPPRRSMGPTPCRSHPPPAQTEPLPLRVRSPRRPPPSCHSGAGQERPGDSWARKIGRRTAGPAGDGHLSPRRLGARSSRKAFWPKKITSSRACRGPVPACVCMRVHVSSVTSPVLGV